MVYSGGCNRNLADVSNVADPAGKVEMTSNVHILRGTANSMRCFITTG